MWRIQNPDHACRTPARSHVPQLQRPTLRAYHHFVEVCRGVRQGGRQEAPFHCRVTHRSRLFTLAVAVPFQVLRLRWASHASALEVPSFEASLITEGYQHIAKAEEEAHLR